MDVRGNVWSVCVWRRLVGWSLLLSHIKLNWEKLAESRHLTLLKSHKHSTTTKSATVVAIVTAIHISLAYNGWITMNVRNGRDTVTSDCMVFRLAFGKSAHFHNSFGSGILITLKFSVLHPCACSYNPIWIQPFRQPLSLPRSFLSKLCLQNWQQCGNNTVHRFFSFMSLTLEAKVRVFLFNISRVECDSYWISILVTTYDYLLCFYQRFYLPCLKLLHGARTMFQFLMKSRLTAKNLACGTRRKSARHTHNTLSSACQPKNNKKHETHISNSKRCSRMKCAFSSAPSFFRHRRWRFWHKRMFILAKMKSWHCVTSEVGPSLSLAVAMCVLLFLLNKFCPVVIPNG